MRPDLILPGLEVFRTGWQSKLVSLLTLFVFSFVFYLSPTSRAVAEAATEDERRQQAIEAVLENTPEKKLAHRLGKLKHKVLVDIPRGQQKRLDESSFWDDLINLFSDGGTLSESEREMLLDLHDGIEAAWADASAAFDAEESKLQSRHGKGKLPRVALERQEAARAKIQARYTELLDKLQLLILEPGEDTFTALQQFLEAQQFQRPQGKDDPDQLPFGVMKNRAREPITDQAALQNYLDRDPLANLPQYAEIGVTQEMLDEAFARAYGPAEADLAETPDVQLTDAIRAKAEELNHDPVAIYTWVHNNIRFIPSYGSIQGADMTLQTLRGNATDTASLLIALLRASNIPARYAYGTVDIPIDQAKNWAGGVEDAFALANLMGQGGIPNVIRTTGGVPTSIRIEHTWVEAYVDFEPSRGMKLHNLDTWVPIDASFKQYDFSDGYNLEENVPFDAQPLITEIENTATINESEGWVQNVPQQAVEDQLTQFQQQLEDYIENQNPEATVGEVLGIRELKVIEPRPLSAGLPYKLISRQQHFSEVPDNQRHKFSYTLATTDSFGNPAGQLFSFTENTVDLAGKKLALSFKPATEDDEAIIESYLPEADPDTGEIDPGQLPDTLPGYLINLTAEFSKNGETSHTAAAGTMGQDLHERLGLYSPAHGWTRTTNYPVAGEYRAIGLDLQGTSPEQALQLQQRVQNTQAILQSQDEAQLATLTKHEVVGDLIYGTIFSYFALNNIQDEIAQQTADMVSYRAPSYGMFSTALSTQYWFGVPRNVSFSGLSMDVDRFAHQTVDINNNTQQWIAYNRAIGSRYSAMEHLVPEQMFSTEETPAQGISAVKAIALASQEGQRIYTITSQNLNSALNALELSPESETEIRNSVNAGFEVTTHRYEINFNGWIGEGYIIADPSTGSGAYKIAGGENGSWISGLIWIGIAIWLTVLVSAVIVAVLTLNIPALLVAFSGITTIIDIVNAAMECTAIQYIAVVMAYLVSFIMGLLAAIPIWLDALIMSVQAAIPDPEGC